MISGGGGPFFRAVADILEVHGAQDASIAVAALEALVAVVTKGGSA